jgi:hypothetical protein
VILEFRSIPCADEGCPTVLAGPTHPDLCEDCAGAFEQQGFATALTPAPHAASAGVNEQLALEVEDLDVEVLDAVHREEQAA